ncbi:MAG: hypothetical protein JST89_10105 [Cyanobacteria bacterium SZAS-4]|nr:hypothetical protein [Cyanobacteria bacterium SZAS-4]
MSSKAAEHAEQHQITKGDSHNGAHTASFQHEAQALLGGLVNNAKHAAQDVQHIDFSDPFKGAAEAVKHAAGAVDKAVDGGWNALDHDKNGHFFKHDICGDNKGMAVVAGGTVIGLATIPAMALAPAVLTAAGVSESAALVASMTGVFGATGIKFDYDRRHPNQ